MHQSVAVPAFVVANLARLCHKRNLIARLIKGCRVDARAGCFAYEIIEHFQRSNEHFSRPDAFTGAFVVRQQESQMPKLKTKSGAKKRFKVTATRHGMIKRTKKQIRQLRGTRVLFKTDGDNIKKYFLPNA